jgi:hypothetical protein
MKATFKRSYVKQETGNTVFVYDVTGTKEELEAYKNAQGDKYVEDEETKTPLLFVVNYGGKSMKLGISRKSGKVYVDNSETRAAESLINQFKPGALQNALAGEVARGIMAQAGLFRSTSTAPVAAATPAAEEAAPAPEEKELEQL